ncbi:MAG: YbjQ family protein [Oscillospiraceae bacterium]|nr:YbjQ family protein [Oscillospiraceae bacterium]
MVLTTISNLGDQKFQVLGMVSGSMVQSKNMFKDIGAGLKGMIGGELRAYTEMMQEARDEATRRMMAQADSLGADAILGVRYATSSIVQGAAEVLVTGTAVRLL